MTDTGSPHTGRKTEDVRATSPSVEIEIRALVAAEVQTQLDRERAILKEAGSIPIKIVGGTFAILLAILTVFGLTTWKEVAKETTAYMKLRVDELIQKSDSETSVNQILKDLVNRAIISSELASMQRNKEKELELPKYEWDRLKGWLKLESLGNQEFSDALAILNAQSQDRKKVDANGFLSEMLNPGDGSSYQWIKKQPDKRIAIMSNFTHPDMGASAVELARSSALSEEIRISAVKYIRDMNYTDAFDKLIALESTAEDGNLKDETLITCASLRPNRPQFFAEIKKLIAQPTTNALITAIRIVLELWRTGAIMHLTAQARKDMRNFA